jgi:tetrahydromethanopterin S-methyltransferase subunit H
MITFKTEQKIFEIGGVKFGGQPGENPTVLIGSIFYHGHKIVDNEKTGEFNREEAERLIKLQEEYSDKTGNPGLLDVVGATEDAMCKFIDFVADVTERPFLIDSPSTKVKITGAKHAKEVGIEKRAVYNSILPGSEPEEFKVLMESKVESAIVLAYKSGVMTSDARVKALKELLPKIEKAGITKPLLDTFVIDIPSLSLACKAMLTIKSELGLPCGCGAHNAIATWGGLKTRLGVQAVRPCTVAVNVTPVVLGADFILYGPVEDCQYVFPAVYTINASYKHLKKAGEHLEL